MKNLLIFGFLFCSFHMHSQNAQDIIDGLKNDLKTNIDDKKRATIYSDLTWYYSNISTDSALVYGNKAIAESIKIKDSVILAQAYSDVAAVYFRKVDYESSKKSFLKAYAIRKMRNDKVGMAKVSANLANIYNKENKKELALKSYLEAVEYFEKINNPEVVAITNGNIGVLFNDLKNYPKALYYTKKAIEYQEKNKQHAGLATSYLTLGNVKLRLKDTLNALKYYEKSIVSSKIIGNNLSLSSAYNNISKIKRDQKKEKEVNALLTKSVEIRKQLNPLKDESILSMSVAGGYIINKEFTKARELLLKLKKDYSNNKYELLQCYQYLAQTYSYLNQPDSVNYYSNLSMELQDRVIEEIVAKQTNELETKYQTAKKEKLILEKEAENKTKNNWIIIISILAGFISLVGFLIYRQQKLKNQQQEQEFQLKSAITQIETQNQLQEQRLSISRDLHDNIGAQLTFVISSVDNLKYGNQISDNRVVNQLTKISDFTKSTIVELRDTIWAMNNNDFSFDDLRSRIYNFIEKAKSAKEEIAFKFNVDESLNEVRFSSIIGINLYRTIQEALNNAVKYSEATTILVTIETQKDKTKIEIKDNGKGFDLETVDFGNGLHNMKKRVEEVGGTFEIHSQPNKGTTIQFFV